MLKWVVRKEFGELRRYLEVEEAGFMQQVETSAASLISSLQNQTDQLNQNLNRLQEAHNTLQDLSNEGHLDFIMVHPVSDQYSMLFKSPGIGCGPVSVCFFVVRVIERRWSIYLLTAVKPIRIPNHSGILFFSPLK